MSDDFKITQKLEEDGNSLRMRTEFPCACGKGTFWLTESYDQPSMMTYTTDADCRAVKMK